MRVLVKPVVLTVAALFAFSAFSVIADSPVAKDKKKAAYAVKVRQSVLTLMGSNMGPLRAMAKGKMPFDSALAEKNATRIAQLSDMIPDSFRLNTTTYDLKTDALDGIWDDFSEFEDKAMATSKAAVALASAARAGDESAVKKAIGRMGKSCGSCHNDFKKDD